MHIQAGAHLGCFCPRLLIVRGAAGLLLHGVVCEPFVTESKFGCLSEPVGSGSKTRFWFRPEVQRALASLQKYPAISSGETPAWLQTGVFLRLGLTCPEEFLVFGGRGNWCGDEI